MSETDPARIVADADVLAADLLVGGSAREVLDQIRQHDWLTLVASDELLADTKHIIATLAAKGLATDWYARIEDERTVVSHPPEDHPALASAYRGNAAHLVSFDENLTSAATNRSLQSHVTLSIRTPDAFATLFDPESLYESLYDDAYSGPDRDPRE